MINVLNYQLYYRKYHRHFRKYVNTKDLFINLTNILNFLPDLQTQSIINDDHLSALNLLKSIQYLNIFDGYIYQTN